MFGATICLGLPGVPRMNSKDSERRQGRNKPSVTQRVKFVPSGNARRAQPLEQRAILRLLSLTLALTRTRPLNSGGRQPPLGTCPPNRSRRSKYGDISLSTASAIRLTARSGDPGTQGLGRHGAAHRPQLPIISTHGADGSTRSAPCRSTIGRGLSASSWRAKPIPLPPEGRNSGYG